MFLIVVCYYFVLAIVYLKKTPFCANSATLILAFCFTRDNMGACGPVDRVLDSRSGGLGFDSHCRSCVEVLGKLLIPYCLCPPNSDGYLVERKLENCEWH